MVRGYQGNGDSTSIAACLKHFVGYGATEGGRDYNTVELSKGLCAMFISLRSRQVWTPVR